MASIDDLARRYREAREYLFERAGKVALCFPGDIAIKSIAKMQEDRDVAAVMLADAILEERGDVDRDPAVQTESG